MSKGTSGDKERGAHYSVDIGAKDAAAEDCQSVADIAHCMTGYGLLNQWRISITYAIPYSTRAYLDIEPSVQVWRHYL